MELIPRILKSFKIPPQEEPGSWLSRADCIIICMLAINKAGRHTYMYISIYHISYNRLCRIVNLKGDAHQWKND